MQMILIHDWRCQQSGIALSASEQSLLERLADFVEWAGRYPVGVSTLSTTKDAGMYYASDRDTVFSFVAKLNAMCDAIDPQRDLYKKWEAELDDQPS